MAAPIRPKSDKYEAFIIEWMFIVSFILSEDNIYIFVYTVTTTLLKVT